VPTEQKNTEAKEKLGDPVGGRGGSRLGGNKEKGSRKIHLLLRAIGLLRARDENSRPAPMPNMRGGENARVVAERGKKNKGKATSESAWEQKDNERPGSGEGKWSIPKAKEKTKLRKRKNSTPAI